MLFNSFGFIFLFLPTVFGVWYVLQRLNIKAANLFLILVSLGFYATLDATHLPLLFFSIIVNFLLGMRLQKAVDCRACHCEASAVAISMTEKKLGIMDGLLVGAVLFLAFKMMMGEPSRSFVYFVF